MYSTANGIFPREVKEDHTLKVDGFEYPVKKGTILNSQTFSTHYNETIYKDPKTFNPERFINSEGKIIMT